MSLSLADIQTAAKMIEIDGNEAYYSVRERYGEDMANILLVTHLRRFYGSLDRCPPDSAIDTKVNEMMMMRELLS